ncbi:MAG TPA: glycosyltransferase [Negativicutes bacterium]|jgi:glycosyltransferase involved in cell wall biosynthesis
MKVAIVMAWFAPYRLPLFRELAKSKNIDLTVIFCSGAESGNLREVREFPFKFKFLRSRTILSYRYRHIFGDRNTIRYPSGLFSTLRSVAPDIVVAYEFRSECMLAALYSLISGCGYITWSDTTALQENRLGNLRKIVRRTLLSHSSALIGSSSDTLDFFNGAYAYPVERTFLSILSAHVDPFVARANEAQSELSSHGLTRFLYVGQLIPRKGVDLLITAFAALKKKIPTIQLSIVGVGEDADLLKKLSSDLGCGGDIKFKGYIQHDLLVEEFLTHDIFVFPTRLDVFGLVVAEAVACGMPVICSCRAGAARDLVKDNGFIIDPENVAELTLAMEKLARSPELRSTMRETSQTIMKKQNLSNAVHGFVEAVGKAFLEVRCSNQA